MIMDDIMKQIILNSLRSKLLDRTSFNDLPESFWKRTGALNTWGTNAIEGNTITREDADHIILDGKSVSDKPIKDVIETIQHEKAFEKLVKIRQKEITLKTVLELHDDIFHGLLPDAGQWRRINVRIKKASFTPERLEKVVLKMESWERDYRERDLSGESVFSLGAWMHFEFERIHPFSDGNGRVGRLLLNLHFLRKNWPPIHILPQDRKQYLNALSSIDIKNDFVPLEIFLKKLMGSSLVDLLDQVGTTSEDKLITLKEVSNFCSYTPQYLALRCKQGILPSIKHKGEWLTSKRALELYISHIAR